MNREYDRGYTSDTAGKSGELWYDRITGTWVMWVYTTGQVNRYDNKTAKKTNI